MKNNVRSKIKDFLKSEDGRVGAKSPLALGVASASVLLAQAVVTTPAQAHMECVPDSNDCGEGAYCAVWCDEWSLGSCIGEWHSQCEAL